MRKVCNLILLIAVLVPGALAQTAGSAEDYLKSAVGSLQSGKTEEALNHLNRSIELDPRQAVAFLLRGNIRERKGETGAAESDYSRAIELAPSARGMEAGYNNRSVIRLTRGDIDGALADINAAIKLNPRIGAFYNQRAIVRLQAGERESSAADYRTALELNPGLPSARYGLGVYHLHKSELDAALAHFDEAIKLLPSYAQAYVSRGVVRGLKGELDGAIPDIKKGVTLDPDAASDQGKGRFSTPSQELSHFITVNPDHARAYGLRGVLRLIQGKDAQAAQDFRRCVEIAPELTVEVDTLVKEIKRLRPPTS